MARLPFFAALQAAIGPTEQGMVGPSTAARPDGAIVWACCATPAQVSAVQTLAHRLADDGEIVTIIPTLPDATTPDIQICPNTKRATRAFLDHWKPQIVIWFGGAFTMAPLLEIKRTQIPAILVEASTDSFDQAKAPRINGKLRVVLSSFVAVLAVNDTAKSRLIKMGADPKTTRTLGVLEDGITPPPYNEAERADLVKALQTRPMWLAADVPMAELDYVADAHHHAERRAHRTLLILTPRNPAEGVEMTAHLRDAEFTVAHRSAGETPKEATQIYVVDTNEGLGLWCRLAPITYLGGSLSDGLIPDPFAPATVGSAIVVGPKVTRFQDHLDRLFSADATHIATTPANLGGAVETLLATDYAARLAHAAWDVTSRGADATNELVTLIYTYLDKADH